MNREHDFLDPAFLKPEVLAHADLRTRAEPENSLPSHRTRRLHRK